MFFPISEVKGWLADPGHFDSLYAEFGPDGVAGRIREFRGYVAELADTAASPEEQAEHSALREYLCRLEDFAAEAGVPVPCLGPVVGDLPDPDQWLVSLGITR